MTFVWKLAIPFLQFVESYSTKTTLTEALRTPITITQIRLASFQTMRTRPCGSRLAVASPSSNIRTGEEGVRDTATVSDGSVMLGTIKSPHSG